MDQFRPDSEAPQPGVPARAFDDGLADSGEFRDVIERLERSGSLELRDVPAGLADRIFIASVAHLDGAEVGQTVATGRPSLRLVEAAGERSRSSIPAGAGELGRSNATRRRHAGSPGARRIGPVLAMAASIAGALILAIPAAQLASHSRDARQPDLGLRAGGAGAPIHVDGGVASTSSPLQASGAAFGADGAFDTYLAGFTGSFASSNAAEPTLVSLLQQRSEHARWPGVRAVPISSESAASDLLSILEARDVHVNDLADDLARMRRDAKDRS